MAPTGDIRFISGIKIAHLALKHRQGKNHKTRIVAFVGSPIEADEKEMVKLAKKLKKEKVNIDIVNFGEDEANADLLNKFVTTINGKEGTGSHLVTIPPGPHLSDALVSSPIVQVASSYTSLSVTQCSLRERTAVVRASQAQVAVALSSGWTPTMIPSSLLPSGSPWKSRGRGSKLREVREFQNFWQSFHSTIKGGETEAVVPATPGQGEESSEEALLQRALAMSMDT